jgi:hypothetical protein
MTSIDAVPQVFKVAGTRCLRDSCSGSRTRQEGSNAIRPRTDEGALMVHRLHARVGPIRYISQCCLPEPLRPDLTK